MGKKEEEVEQDAEDPHEIDVCMIRGHWGWFYSHVIFLDSISKSDMGFCDPWVRLSLRH